MDNSSSDVVIFQMVIEVLLLDKRVVAVVVVVSRKNQAVRLGETVRVKIGTPKKFPGTLNRYSIGRGNRARKKGRERDLSNASNLAKKETGRRFSFASNLSGFTLPEVVRLSDRFVRPGGELCAVALSFCLASIMSSICSQPNRIMYV